MTRRRSGVGLLVASSLLLAGCGSTAQGGTSTTGKSTDTTAQSPQQQKQAAAVSVIREWAAALQQGHMQAAASYFALPSVFANGVGANGLIEAVEIHSKQDAEAVNESLSCGAKLISTHQDGKYLKATFTLTNRKGPGADCGTGTGEPAATDFVIKNGHIVEWIRAAVSAPTPTITAPKTATNPPSSGASV